MASKLIKCKSCGEEIAKGAKTCPKCGAKNKRKPIVLAVILILIGVIAISQALSGGSPKKVGDAQAPKVSKAPNEGRTTFAVGDKVDLNSIIVTLVNVSENDGGNYMSPSDGKVFAVCEFEIENNSASDIGVSSMLSFEAYVDDYATTMSLPAMLSTGKRQLDGSVAAGKKMNGVIGYEVAPDWSELEIRFAPDFWTGKKITFVATK